MQIVQNQHLQYFEIPRWHYLSFQLGLWIHMQFEAKILIGRGKFNTTVFYVAEFFVVK
jgi:hypothetical protein